MDAELQEDCDAYVALQITSIPATESMPNSPECIHACTKHIPLNREVKIKITGKPILV